MSRSTDSPQVSIVIVNWNTCSLLRTCLASIEQNVDTAYEVIVVDNGSADSSVEMMQNRFPAVRVVALPENTGFSRGNNAGLAETRGDILLLLNSDTEMKPGTVETLVGFFAAHPRAGMAGPPLWNPDGSPQVYPEHLPTLTGEFLRQTMLYGLFRRTAGRRSRGTDPRPVENLSGAALAVRRECYNRIGPLDPAITLFYEDTDWCRRALSAGWEVWFVPCPGVVHVKAAASKSDRTRTLVEHYRSVVYYFRKHSGPAHTAALRLIILCGVTLRSARAALLWTCGFDRADQSKRLKAYDYVFRRVLTRRMF